MDLEEFHSSATERVLITGLPGTGKTTLAVKLAEYFRIHYICVENSGETLFKLPREWWPNVKIYNIPDSAVAPMASQTLMLLFKKRKGNICRRHGMWECPLCKKEGNPLDAIDLNAMEPDKDIVILDTGTQLAYSILAHLTKDKAVDYKPERDDWGALRKYTEFFASEFQAANFNFICISHVTEATMEDGKVKLVPDFGSAKMSAAFAKAFGHVVYTDIRNRKHVAGSSSLYAGNVLTKSRTDFRIEDLPEPSLVPLFRDKGKTQVQSTPGEVAIKHLQEMTKGETPTPETPKFTVNRFNLGKK